MFAIYLLLSIYIVATYLQGANLHKSIFIPFYRPYIFNSRDKLFQKKSFK